MDFLIGADTPNSATTGVARQMHGLGCALANRGHRVEYVFKEDVPRRLPERFSRLEYPIRVAALARVRGALARKPLFALLHEPTGWPTALAARRSGVRLLAMVHGCELKMWRDKLRTRAMTGERVKASSRVLWPATELWQSWLSLRLAHRIFCLSSEDRKYISATIGVPHHRISRIDNGVDRSFLGRDRSRAPRSRDILFLGSWIPRKGTRFLGEALAKLSQRGRSATLTIAGTGVENAEVRRLLPPPWRDSARVISHLEPTELVATYEDHKIFVLPSLGEGIPLSLLEAMACGLCCVATRVGGIPDVIHHGQDGFLVEPMNAQALAECVDELLTSPGVAERVGQTAQQAMQQYSWDHVAAQVEDALEGRDVAPAVK